MTSFQGWTSRVFELFSSLDSSTSFLIFVTVSVAFSSFLLNGAPKYHSIPLDTTVHRDPKISPKKPMNNDRPEPKWHVLKLLNFASVFTFVSSILYFASDLPTYLNDSSTLLKFITAWSVFLCYFIGFFGISFVDADEFCEEEARTENPSSVSRYVTTRLLERRMFIPIPLHSDNRYLRFSPPIKKVENDYIQPLTSKVVEKKDTILHPPAECRPLCGLAVENHTKATTTLDTVKDGPISLLSNIDVMNMVLVGKVKDHELEKTLDDPHRAVEIRRLVFESKLGRNDAFNNLPYLHSLDYSKVFGTNCEVVVGYVPIPVGMVGPIVLNDENVYFPMATTEGCLVASTNRGCKAISLGSGAYSSIVRDGITRAPCLQLPTAREAAELKVFCDQEENFKSMKAAFESTTSFGKLLSAETTVAGRNLYIRLCCFSGDAMGMNMVSKGSLAVCDFLKIQFPNASLVALSGNLCTDKKAAAINWIQGRGKSVVVEATIPKAVVQSILKTEVQSLVAVNTNKNLIGSAMAGTIGGFNAHAANIVTAIFLATGQDPAQNVESSNCITLMEETDDGDLWISCTMPSIEVGTVGGGTSLPAQEACLKIIGCNGGSKTPGENSKKLAHVIAAATMAGELSLLAALSSNTLVQAHMQHNRKAAHKN